MYGSGPRVATRYASAVGRNVAYGQRPACQGDGLEVLLERGELTALPWRLGEDDTLSQNRVALRLLHTWK